MTARPTVCKKTIKIFTKMKDLGHEKLIICFSGTARVTFNPNPIKLDYSAAYLAS